MGIKEGDKGIFHPSHHPDAASAAPEPADVVKVWSETCVNLRTQSGAEPTSVFVVADPEQERPLGGYFFVPGDFAAVDPAPANDLIGYAGEKTFDELTDELVKDNAYIMSESFKELRPSEQREFREATLAKHARWNQLRKG